MEFSDDAKKIQGFSLKCLIYLEKYMRVQNAWVAKSVQPEPLWDSHCYELQA